MPLAGEQITPTASTFAGSPLESPELAAAGLRTRLVQGFATGRVPGVIALARRATRGVQYVAVV